MPVPPVDGYSITEVMAEHGVNIVLISQWAFGILGAVIALLFLVALVFTVIATAGEWSVKRPVTPAAQLSETQTAWVAHRQSIFDTRLADPES